MAIIKCPECGHQVSEKAPTCPGCGVEIAGKIVRCTDCGNVYFSDQMMCPACHRPNERVNNRQYADAVPVSPAKPAESAASAPLAATAQDGAAATRAQQPRKKSYSVLIFSFVFVLLLCGVCFFYYNDAKNQKEREDYEYALSSNDPLVLQNYLARYKDADPAHRDSIQACLNRIQQIDTEWSNAVVSGTREAIENYLKEHPDSPHKGEGLNKLDSMDFLVAQKANTMEAYQDYLKQHPDGKYSDQAKNEVDALKAKTVSSEETAIVKGLFRRFFQSVNSRNEDGMLATVAETLSSFLGRTSAGKADVAQFLQKIYKADITNMNWHILDDYKIDKREIGQGEYEYIVKFTAEQNIERTDPSQPKYNRYSISATVSTEGKISEFNMIKLAE